MIYVGKPHHWIYVVAIFLYISIYNVMIDFHGEGAIIYGSIVVGIMGILYYWRHESYNKMPLMVACGVALINVLRYYHGEGFVIIDGVVEGFSQKYLKKYSFITVHGQGYGKWTLRKIKNQWIIGSFTPMKQPATSSLVAFFQNKFPHHYGFFLGILLGHKEYFKPYRAFNALGLGHYTAVSGMHVNLLFQLILMVCRLIFFNHILVGYYGAFGLSLIAITYLHHWNHSPSLLRASLAIGAQILCKIFHWRYSPWCVWFFSFLLIHTWDPLIMYHSSFIMSFFLVLIFFINGGFFLLMKPNSHGFIKEILINLMVLIFFIHFFDFFNTFYFCFNIIFKYYMHFMIIVGFLSLLMNGVARCLDYCLDLTLPTIKILSQYNFFVGFGQLGNFNQLIFLLFLIYGLFCLKFIHWFNLLAYIFFLIAIYFLFFYGLSLWL
jgi:hypothetical protein